MAFSGVYQLFIIMTNPAGPGATAFIAPRKREVDAWSQHF
jgi:hypothetical protein